jgi:hypothetical protein
MKVCKGDTTDMSNKRCDVEVDIDIEKLFDDDLVENRWLDFKDK